MNLSGPEAWGQALQYAARASDPADAVGFMLDSMLIALCGAGLRAHRWLRGASPTFSIRGETEGVLIGACRIGQ